MQNCCILPANFQVHGPTSKELRIVSCEETSFALDILCRLVQQDAFASEIKLLKGGKPLGSTSRLGSLSPFLDDKGLMRVGGRLNNSH